MKSVYDYKKKKKLFWIKLTVPGEEKYIYKFNMRYSINCLFAFILKWQMDG